MSETPRSVIDAHRGSLLLEVRELFHSRELLAFLVWRDIKVRYKQTVLGVAWAVLQPILMTIVFTLFFGRVAGVDSGDLPYEVFSLSGLVLWTFFSQSVGMGASSLVGSSNLITKVYFPRMVVPAASVFSGLVDLAVATPVLMGVAAGFGIIPGVRLFLAPLMVLLALVSTLGAVLWLSALNVEYRDVRYVIPFLLQIWLFVSPVIYPATGVVSRIEELGLPGWIFAVNPMVGAIEGFRWAIVGGGVFPGELVLVSTGAAMVMFATGFVYFQRVERGFADVI